MSPTPMCRNGHPLEEIARKTIVETIDDVAYQKERIKHFDREGSEFWAEVNVPIIVERQIEVDLLTLRCPTCGDVKKIRQNKPAAPGG